MPRRMNSHRTASDRPPPNVMLAVSNSLDHHTTPGPTRLVGSGVADGDEHHGHSRSKIVVGVTHDAASRTALRWAYRVALAADAVLYVVTAYHPSWPVVTIDGRVYADEHDAADATRLLQRAVLGTELGLTDMTASIQSIITSGQPVAVLVAASNDADLLVVGRRASRLRRFLTTSTSKGCANGAACPVVIVHANDGRSHDAEPVVAPALRLFDRHTERHRRSRLHGVFERRDPNTPHHNDVA